MAVGYQLVVADGVLSSAGEPVAVYGMNIISTGGGGAVIKLRSGSAVSGTIIIQETGTTSQGKSFNYGGNGIVFPSGCYVDVDANTTSVAIEYQRLK
jgi:hypothetical protein